VQSQLNKYPTEIFSYIEVAGGRIWIKPEGIKYFAGDLSGRPTIHPLDHQFSLVWQPPLHCPIQRRATIDA
jgi:hypothetical protein